MDQDHTLVVYPVIHQATSKPRRLLAGAGNLMGTVPIYPLTVDQVEGIMGGRARDGFALHGPFGFRGRMVPEGTIYERWDIEDGTVCVLFDTNDRAEAIWVSNKDLMTRFSNRIREMLGF